MARRAAQTLEADAPPVDTNPWRDYFRALAKTVKTPLMCGAASCTTAHTAACGLRIRTVDPEGRVTVTEDRCGIHLCDDHGTRAPNGSTLCPWHLLRARELGLLTTKEKR